MKQLFTSIIKCIFYSFHSKNIIGEIEKNFIKTLNKKLLKENYILFIIDLIKYFDKSVISLTKYNNKFYINKKITNKRPDYIIINKDDVIIDLITKLPMIEKKYNIKTNIQLNNTELIINNSTYILDSYITNDNDNHITKTKLNLKYIKDYKLLFFILKNDDSYSTSNTENEKKIDSSSSNTKNNVDKSIKKIKSIIKNKQDLIKTTNNKKDISKLKLEIKQYTNILLSIKYKLTKKDYITLIKEKYPHYVYLDKYTLDELKEIYNRNCNNIDIYYDGANSCYIDSLLVALFNKKNPIIEDLLFNSPIIDYNNDDLRKIAIDIKKELFKLYRKISHIEVREDINKCINLRKLFQNYINIYIKKINKKFNKINWTTGQNDYTDILTFLQIIFNIPNTLKFRRNNNIEYRFFLDVFPLDLFINNNDILKVKDYYPKYSNTFDYITDNGIQEYYTDNIEYLSTPLLFIQFNRIYYDEKLNTIIIPPLKLKLKENKHPLYLNAILIQQYGSIDSGHYISLYECNNIWYEFNDLNKKNIKIGSFNKILENEDYTRNITGLYYV